MPLLKPKLWTCTAFFSGADASDIFEGGPQLGGLIGAGVNVVVGALTQFAQQLALRVDPVLDPSIPGEGMITAGLTVAPHQHLVVGVQKEQLNFEPILPESSDGVVDAERESASRQSMHMAARSIPSPLHFHKGSA